jgi:hypothetical protein
MQGQNTFHTMPIKKTFLFALENRLKPSCGCDVNNIASQKNIEKSGFVSKHKLICFAVE